MAAQPMTGRFSRAVSAAGGLFRAWRDAGSMHPEEDFRRLLDKFGEHRVRLDVESDLYSPVRLAWARAWLAEKAAGLGDARPATQAAIVDVPPGTTDAAEARRLAADANETAAGARRSAADANEIAAEAARLAREAKALARRSRAAARTAGWLAATAAVVAAGTVGAALALFQFHVV